MHVSETVCGELRIVNNCIPRLIRDPLLCRSIIETSTAFLNSKRPKTKGFSRIEL